MSCYSCLFVRYLVQCLLSSHFFLSLLEIGNLKLLKLKSPSPLEGQQQGPFYKSLNPIVFQQTSLVHINRMIDSSNNWSFTSFTFTIPENIIHINKNHSSPSLRNRKGVLYICSVYAIPSYSGSILWDKVNTVLGTTAC